MPTWTWLALGVVVTALAGNRFNVAVLGFVASVPWLLYLRRTTGLKSRLLLFAAMQLGIFLSILKIITEPLPWFFAAMFSVPMATVGALIMISFEAWRRRVGDAWGVALFAALEACASWSSANLSEVGSWGSLGYTQLDNLPLLQVTSLFGLAGLNALLAASSAAIAVFMDAERGAPGRRSLVVVFAVVVAAFTYGGLRLHVNLPAGPLVTVATVSTDIGLGGGGEVPSTAAIDKANEALFRRTEEALQKGAQVVVWNEGSTIVEKQDEEAFIARGQALASHYGGDVVLAFVVPLDGMRHFENKYVWLGPSGEVETYFKHHPVPGEGSVKGEAPIRVLDRPWGKAAGAICYDYDFPSLGLEHARQGAGLVVVPASDWRGIDPFHTQMARVRGIEGGFSVVRSVRWATSGAFDALGQARGLASYFEGERLMIARVPTTQVSTLYTKVGDVLPLAAALLLVAGIVRARRRRQG